MASSLKCCRDGGRWVKSLLLDPCGAPSETDTTVGSGKRTVTMTTVVVWYKTAACVCVSLRLLSDPGLYLLIRRRLREIFSRLHSDLQPNTTWNDNVPPPNFSFSQPVHLSHKASPAYAHYPSLSQLFHLLWTPVVTFVSVSANHQLVRRQPTSPPTTHLLACCTVTLSSTPPPLPSISLPLHFCSAPLTCVFLCQFELFHGCNTLF